MDTDVTESVDPGVSRFESWYRHQASDATPKQLPPWMWPDSGWKTEVEAWIRRALLEVGREPAGALEEVKSWSISCVYKIRTRPREGVSKPTIDPAADPESRTEKADPWVYFKASTPLPYFVNEAAITRTLTTHFPEYAPEILAVHDEFGWLLTEDLGKPIRHSKDQDPEALLNDSLRFIQQSVVLQKRSRAFIPELEAAGCLDRRLPRLREEWSKVMRHPLSQSAVPAEFLKPLVDQESQTLEAFIELESMGPAPTLVHGDLHLGNAAARGSDFVLFDWTDASIAHPFVDSLSIHWERDAGRARQMKEAYLDAWQDEIEGLDHERLWLLGTVAAQAHLVTSYLHILDNLADPENSGLWEGMCWHAEPLLAALNDLQGI